MEVMAIEGDTGLGLFNLQRIMPYLRENRPFIAEGATYYVSAPEYLKHVLSEKYNPLG
ncbi:hypothetical protein D3C83_140590 [compost metagenome]